MKVIYRASDGTEFETQHECEKHEEKLAQHESAGTFLFLACVIVAIVFFL